MRKFLLVLLLGFSGISLFGVSVNWLSAYDKLSVLSFGKDIDVIADNEEVADEKIDYIFYSRDDGEFQAFINLKNAYSIRFLKDKENKSTRLVIVFDSYSIVFSTNSKAKYPLADIEINGRILMLTDGTGWDPEIANYMKTIPYFFSNGALPLSKYFRREAEYSYDKMIKPEGYDFLWHEVFLGRNIGILAVMRGNKIGIGIDSSYETPTYVYGIVDDMEIY